MKSFYYCYYYKLTIMHITGDCVRKQMRVSFIVVCVSVSTFQDAGVPEVVHT